MRHLPSDKYNIAWFKLAEFVARGEKERALGMYRLLIHSFDDKALAYQLEGDLHLAFKDTVLAIGCYNQAAALYCLSEKYIEAAAIYEHIKMLNPYHHEAVSQLVHLYKLLQQEGPFERSVEDLCQLFLHKDEVAKVEHLLASEQEVLSSILQGKIYRLLTFYALDRSLHEEQVMHYVRNAIDHFLKVDDAHHIRSFFAKLHVASPEVYQEAVTYAQYDDVV